MGWDGLLQVRDTEGREVHHRSHIDEHCLVVVRNRAIQDAFSDDHAVAQDHMVERTFEELHGILKFACNLTWLAHIALEDPEEEFVFCRVFTEESVFGRVMDEDCNLSKSPYSEK